MLRQRAEEGLRLMENAVVELLAQHPKGLTNSQIARELGLGSDYQGHHQGYLSWSIMGLLLNSKKVEKVGRLYRLPEQSVYHRQLGRSRDAHARPATADV